MKTIIDRFGRVVVPKDIRNKLGLMPGDEIEIEEHDNEILLRHAEHEEPLRVKDGVLVFSGIAVGDLSESIRRHREERLVKLSSWKKA